MSKHPRPHVGFVVAIVLAFALFYLVPRLPSMNAGNTYMDMVKKVPAKDFMANLEWALGDWADAQFHKTWLGGLLVILGGLLAYYLAKSKSKLAGFGASYGTGLFPQILVGEIIADAISVGLYGRLLATEGAAIGWWPTFIPVCSFVGGGILTFGGGIPQILTIAIMGGLIGGPGSWWISKYLALPFGMPVAIGNVGIMIIGSIVLHQIWDWMPWMHEARMQKKAAAAAAAAAAKTAPAAPAPKVNDNTLLLRRVFADLTECCFFGSEWAGLGLVVGSILLAIVNSANPSYGSKQLGTILCVQILSSALGNWLYWDKLKELGWIATFVSVVGCSPAIVLIFGPTLPVIIFSMLVGGVLSAPIAYYISSRVPEWGHGYTGAVFSILVTTLIGVSTGLYLFAK